MKLEDMNERELDLINKIRQLDEESAQNTLRFVRFLSCGDGFYEAFLAAGGFETLGIDGVNKLMDEWGGRVRRSEKLIEKVTAVDAGNYSMTSRDMMAFFDAGNGDMCSVVMMAFQYGFLRGQNAERNRKRKSVKKTALGATNAESSMHNPAV